MEEWRDVVGYEGSYEVSNQGRVRSVARTITDSLDRTRRLKGRVLRPTTVGSEDRYVGVSLYRGRVMRSRMVHKIVAEAWLGPCPDGCEVDHDDKDGRNNLASNLCYREFKNHARKDKGVRVIRSDGVEFGSMSEAAECSGTYRSHVHSVCKGKRKSAGGYGWEYCDD